MNDQLTWLLQLISAHLLTDFVLQPDSMSEYVLIGTLISISAAVITGFIVSKLIS